MHARTLAGWLVLILTLLGATAGAIEYPPAARVDQVDDYHGTKVADPYRWLEDADSPATKAWVAAENRLTFGWLEGIPARSRIKARLTELWDYEKFGIPFREGGRYFFSRNPGLQNQSAIYVQDSLESAPRLLLDPNQLSPDGTVALGGMSVSENGRLVAYALSTSGSDWMEWKVRDVDTGKDLDDHIQWSKFSGASWTHDGKGFFYGRYDEPGAAQFRDVNYFQKLCYHRIGEPQSKDDLVYHRPDQKEWGFDGQVTEDGRWLVIEVRKGSDPLRQVFYRDLAAPDSKVVELVTGFDAAYDVVGNDGPVLWLRTDQAAPRGRVIAVDITRGAAERREVIPQAAEALQEASVVGDRFIATYLKDAHTVVRVFRLDGALQGEVELPGLGTAAGFHGKRRDNETFYSFTSFTTPPTIYRLELPAVKSSVFRSPRTAFRSEDSQTRQVFYSSKDGTRVPMFLTHKKGLTPDGKSPTILFGYGGFKIPMTPSYSPAVAGWLEMGGVYALPNLRGGGEYGEEWHRAGTKEKKQNVFDDFIAAAEWLIENRITSRERLAIFGGSNGGLLVGACMTQRPDLYAAALPAVGVMDMLRYQKFTIGWAWVSDFGSSDDPKEFQALYRYSPLHNIRPGVAYPATLITTADHDDRVVPLHSFKFAATLQAAQGGQAPVLIRIETKAGHGAGKPTSKLIEEAADRWAFLTKALGMEGG
jgi:prolyl oligopeptidase